MTLSRRAAALHHLRAARARQRRFLVPLRLCPLFLPALSCLIMAWWIVTATADQPDPDYYDAAC